jgi:hypothetical protein
MSGELRRSMNVNPAHSQTVRMMGEMLPLMANGRGTSAFAAYLGPEYTQLPPCGLLAHDLEIGDDWLWLATSSTYVSGLQR